MDIIDNYIKIPEKLHYYLIYFPIVLIILATFYAAISLISGNSFPRMTVFILVLASTASQYIFQAERNSMDHFLVDYSTVEAIFQKHLPREGWTHTGCLGVVLLSVISMFMINIKKISWTLRLFALIGTLFLGSVIYQKGTHGDWMMHGGVIGLLHTQSLSRRLNDYKCKFLSYSSSCVPGISFKNKG